MNNPSPLIPQGSLLDQKNQSRSRVKVAFFCVVGIHVAAIVTALLAQGCKRDPVTPPVTETAQPQVPIAETVTPPADTNPPPTTVDTNVTPVVPIPLPLQGGQPPVEVPPVATPAGSPQEYAVEKGDSFYSIGKKFNVSMKAIQDANPNVNPNRLQIGQKLVIPAASAPAPTGGTTTATNEQVYVVKAGDNLTKIATQHGVTLNALRRANNLTTDRIKPGDKLKIPAPAPR